MEEQLISFETAKLAKEKKFTIPTRDFYADLSWNNKEIYSVSEVGYDEFTSSMEKEHGFGNIILIPTQSLLQKWLREVHNLIVIPIYGNSNYWFNIFNSKNNYLLIGSILLNLQYKTYEEALEQGLQEALKLIK